MVAPLLAPVTPAPCTGHRQHRAPVPQPQPATGVPVLPGDGRRKGQCSCTEWWCGPHGSAVAQECGVAWTL